MATEQAKARPRFKVTRLGNHPAEKALGICPSCGEAVYHADDPVWFCPADLPADNAYAVIDPRSEAEQEQSGVYANCREDVGQYCPYERVPMHGACYEVWPERVPVVEATR